MINNKRIICVVPAYNAEKTIKDVILAVPKFVDKILVVDDCSKDNTVKEVKKLKIECLRHKINLGYGANQKTCYNYALKNNYDIIVMVHGDNQYNPKEIRKMVLHLLNKEAGFVIGNRIKTATKGKMPKYKFLGNKLHSNMMNLFLRTNLEDYASGYKAYTKELLLNLNYNAFDDMFIFDEQLNILATIKGFKCKNVDIETKYFEDMSSVNWLTSLKYMIQTMFMLIKYVWLRRYPK
jgi:glycosyltransferase involved in cell wall biosynthesis